ncbi:MAG: hypothetical protein JRE23_04375, partial [Deltaproteobacteria bacterium]|nr:hypothetical protein [Deltaproteobacteria bacterium]
TGRIVATGTLSHTKRENNDSGAEAELLVGHGELVWMPKANLTFMAKYRYQGTDVDNPDSTTIVDRLNPATTYL